jgi:ATP-dependent RNA helicase RhlE
MYVIKHKGEIKLMTFQELNIIEPILKALKYKEYLVPTPIQLESIPILLQKKDILGSAQTGTGKTAAFAIPILQNLHLENNRKASKRTIKALVLAPTRELALQIHDNFIEYGKYLDLRTTVIYGGVPQSKQVRILHQGVDILVATPGRLLDLVQQRKLTLSNVSYLVLDEADRMLDMGFVKDVKKIVAMVKKERQTMFFSATMPKAIISLSNEMLHIPVRVMVTPEEEMIDKIKQSVYFVGKKKKIDLLVDLLKKKHLKSVLVFSRTKHGANHIVKLLEQVNIPATAIHGNKSQSARQKALAAFKSKKIRVLVATDIAARGIDVDELSHVINFDLPEVPETYIHRIGRTGRAGLGGFAISFCSKDQADLLRDIQKHINMKIPVMKDSVYALELTDLPTETKNQNSQKKKKPNSQGRQNRSYSRKRSKRSKIEPKNFSKHDSRNQSKNYKNKSKR